MLLGVAAGLLYLFVGPGKEDTDSHLLLAQAFLDGRLHIEGAFPWLELVPRAEGGWYSPFPPLLSVALVPFAALGIQVDTNQVAALMGGLSVALVWVMLGRLEVAPRGPRLPGIDVARRDGRARRPACWPTPGSRPSSGPASARTWSGRSAHLRAA